MNSTEAIFIWIALWFYGFSSLFYLSGIIFKKEKAVRYGSWLAIAGFASQTASIGFRWGATGHPPVMRAYEMALLGSWLTLIVFGLLRFWHRKVEAIGVAVMPLLMLMIGKGIMTRPYLEPMAPPFKSNWLWLHILFAWVAYGAFCVAAGLAILYLLKTRSENKATKDQFYERFPRLGVLNDLTLRLVIFGFVALTVQIGAGALWAYSLWGRYWGWDPIETWSLITWLIYGTYIHLAVTLGWKGSKMAWLAIASLLSLFITYGGIGYMASVHMPMM